MAYSQEIQFRARSLYVAGDNFETIAKKLSAELPKKVNESVIARWHHAKVLGDWDEERVKLRQKAASEVQERLAKARVDAASKHFDDIDTLRQIWKQQLFQPDPTDPTKVLRRGPEGAPVPKQFKPAEHRALVMAYAGIVGIERTILGQDIYSIGQPKEGGGADANPGKTMGEFYDGIPTDIVKSINDMLSANFSDPGEKLEDEEESERAAEKDVADALRAGTAPASEDAAEPTPDLPDDLPGEEGD